MPVDTKADPPFFDHERYERDCPRPDCEGRVVFHFAQLSNAPIEGGNTLSILSKCLDPGCGFKDRYEPVITDHEKEVLCDRFDGDLYIPWSKEHTEDADYHMNRTYSEFENETIRENLKALGYF